MALKVFTFVIEGLGSTSSPPKDQLECIIKGRNCKNLKFHDNFMIYSHSYFSGFHTKINLKKYPSKSFRKIIGGKSEAIDSCAFTF